jgi:putative flippase GtrA
MNIGGKLMLKKIKEFFSKNPTAWEFAKYTIFSLLAGWTELLTFMLLNYILPKNGINKEVSWFLFVYPTEAGGLGALIAFVVSSIIGQALKFITNFKKTFKSTNNILLSAIGFAVMAVIIVVGLNLYVGGILNTALCKVIPNVDLAGALAKAICQFAGFLLAFPVNKFILMRNKPA